MDLVDVPLADNPYLTTIQAAQLAQLSESYLNKLRSTGGGSPFLKIGRRCLYRRDQFEQWLDSHQRSTGFSPSQIGKVVK